MTPTFQHGLVIGKFYPPHAGHHFLIRTAARHCEQLTVVVLPSSGESIPLPLRLQWLRHAYADWPHVQITGVMDDLAVDYHDDHLWAAHVELMREGIRLADRLRPTTRPVDAVFTSEPYGEEMARRFDATPVCLDPCRDVYPVSGTRVRANPASCWRFLASDVQAWLAVRVIIVGAESTGKTTLVQNLTRHFQNTAEFAATQWVAEYGREYSWVKLALARAIHLRQQQPEPGLGDLSWSSGEFHHIALEQSARENALAEGSGPLLIADTDAFATAIWHERYTGNRSPAVESLLAHLPGRRLYLLTDAASVPFVQDGIRDGEHIRAWMHARFHERLAAHGHPWRLVQGDAKACLAQSITAIEEFLAATWNFTAPLG